MDRKAATGTVPPEYDGFRYVRPDAVPAAYAAFLASALAALLLGIVGIPVAITAGGPAAAMATGILAVAAMGTGFAVERHAERREQASRRNPSLFYRTVRTSVAAADGTEMPLSYRLYADGTSSVPELGRVG